MPPSPPNAGHRNNFNALRLLFAASVLLAHSPELIDGNRSRELLTMIFGTLSFGELGVDGFFLISGYLIFQSWQRNPAAFDFMRNRVLRIYPAFIVASLICAFVVGPIGATGVAGYFDEFKVSGFFRGLLYLKRTITPPVFDGHPYPVVNGSMWSIAYEFGCYLLILGLGLAGLLRRRWMVLALALAALIAYGACLAMPQTLGLDPARGVPSSMRFAFIFLTGATYAAYRDILRPGGIGVLIAATALAFTMFDRAFAEIGLAILGGYLVFWLAFADIPLLRRLGASSSDISYGLFLYGWPVQKLLIWFFPGIHPAGLFLAALGLAGGAGYLSWQLVEKPCLRLKIRRSDNKSVATSTAGS